MSAKCACGHYGQVLRGGLIGLVANRNCAANHSSSLQLLRFALNRGLLGAADVVAPYEFAIVAHWSGSSGTFAAQFWLTGYNSDTIEQIRLTFRWICLKLQMAVKLN